MLRCIERKTTKAAAAPAHLGKRARESERKRGLKKKAGRKKVELIKTGIDLMDVKRIKRSG